MDKEEIIKAYDKARFIMRLMYGSLIFVMPILFLIWLLADSESGFKQIAFFIYAGYLMLYAGVMIKVRRCPNCGVRFSRYIHNPKQCPNCHVTLRR